MKRFFPAIRLVAVISLLLNAIWLSPAGAATMPTLAPLGQFSTTGMDTPGAMDLDAAGNLYVADAGTQKIYKFDRYGQLRFTYALTVSGRGLAVTADGARLYVARGNEVAIVDAASGDVLGVLAGNPQEPEFGMAGEIDLDADGHVFVADAGVGRMTVNAYTVAGAFVTQFGGPGGLANYQLGGLAVNGVNQVVLTSRNATNTKVVDVFTLDPATLEVTQTVSYNGNATANFGPTVAARAVSYLRGYAQDSQTRGYLIDYNESRLIVVDAAFAYLGVYPLAMGNDVVFDGDTGRLFVSHGGGKVEVIGVDGGQTPANVNQAPAAPAPQSPVGGSQVATLAPTLQFAAAADPDGDALTYTVTVRQGAATVFSTSTAATSVVVTEALAENGSYSWTVKAVDGQGAESPESVAGSFQVNAVNDPPAAPVVLSPLAGEALGGDGLLSWSASSDPDPGVSAISYVVTVAADAGFTQVVASRELAGTSTALADLVGYAGLATGQGYFWQVRAVDGELAASQPSAAGRFVYATASLRVTANLPGSKVYLGGNHGYPGALLGTAPLEVKDLAPGPVALVVERSGFEPFVTRVEVAAGGSAAVYAKLVAARRPGLFKQVYQGVNGSAGLTVGASAAPFVVDFNGDGALDLLVGDAAGQVRLFPSLAVSRLNKITVPAAQSLALPVLPGAVPFAADWNNDGRSDLLVGVADGTVKLFLNSGSNEVPSFVAGEDLQAAGAVLDFGSAAAPVVIDLDGDARKDLVAGNEAGQLVVCLNQGSDAAPQLAAPALLAEVAGAAVPASVDWDADGRRDLLVTAGGKSYVYLNDPTAPGGLLDGGVVPNVTGFRAAFALDINGTYGKDLLVGGTDGRIDYWTGNSGTLAATYKPALLDKADELAELVALEAPELLAQVTTIRASLQRSNYPAAKTGCQTLAAQLAAGAAKTSASELALLCF